MKQLTLWTRYSPLGASSRLRFYNLVPFLEKLNWQCDIHNFFDDRYLQNFYSGRGKNPGSLFEAWKRRSKDMKNTPAALPALIEYDLLPYLPFAAEKKFLSSRRYILNFDDDVFLRYRKLPWLRNKFPRLLAASAGVICANDHLLKIAGKYQRNLCKLPTIPPEILPGNIAKAERFTLVWIGNPATFPYLAARGNALRKAAEKCDFELLIVGGSSTLPGIDCQLIPWSENSEDHALKHAHAGIMPLPDTPFARGKSAYKLIRYQQYGLPAAASPVGENCQVVQDKITGFFAGSDEEWADAISELANPEVRSKMSPAITAVAGEYHLQFAAEKLDSFLTETLTNK